MERRLALATAFAGAATLGIGTVCMAAVGGVGILGFGSADASNVASVITQVENIDRIVVIASGTVPDTEAPAGDPAAPTPAEPGAPIAQPPATPRATLPGGAPAPTPAPTAGPTDSPTPTPGPTQSTPTTPTTAKTTTTDAPVTTATPTTAKATTTTAKATTTTAAPTSTLPAGVPRDWPAGKPIPPKPANCVKGQLEDNGVWNCEH